MTAILTLAVALTFNSPLFAAEPVRELPADGTWANFQLMEKSTGRDEETSTNVIVALVGKKTMKNEVCRWVEMRFQFDDGTERWHVFKWLVPERKLKLGGVAAFDALEAWRKSGERDTIEINLVDYSGRFSYFFPPFTELKKTGKTTTVDWQRGQLTCDAAELKRRKVFDAGNRALEYSREESFKLSLNEKVPFGVAAASVKIKSIVTGGVESTAHANVYLMDMGMDARSAIEKD